MSARGLLAPHEPLAPALKSALFALSFALPLLAWCAVSYLPFVWHPLVEVRDAGDGSVAGTYDYVRAGQLVEREVFEARNVELARAGARHAVGEPRNPIYLPAPHEVARALVTAFASAPERPGDAWLHESLWHSCTVIFWGFLYAALLAFPLGILCGTFPPLAQLSEPFVDFVRYMPAPVFGALTVAVLGLADAPKIAIVAIGTFFPLVLVVANTTRSVDPALLQAAQTLGASTRQLLVHVVLKAALPALYRDMRIGIGSAWTYLVVAELIGEKSGISAFIYQMQRYRHFENVYASIILIGAVGLCCDQLLALAGRRLFPWQHTAHARRGAPSAAGLFGRLRRTSRPPQSAAVLP